MTAIEAALLFLGTETATQVVAFCDTRLPEAKENDVQIGELDAEEQLIMAAVLLCSDRLQALIKEIEPLMTRRKVGFTLSDKEVRKLDEMTVESKRLEPQVNDLRTGLWGRLRQRLPSCFGQNLLIARGYRLMIRFDSSPEVEA